jgi:hypothetical protein
MKIILVLLFLIYPLLLKSNNTANKLLKAFSVGTEYENNFVNNKHQYKLELSKFITSSCLEKWKEIEVIEVDFLNMGLNLQDGENPKLDFTLFDVKYHSNFHYIDDGYNNIVHSLDVKMLEFTRNTTFSNIQNWINVKKGIGYDFINGTNMILVSELFAGIGFSDLNTDPTIFNFKNENLINKISGIDLSGGLKVYYYDLNWQISLLSNYKVILNRPDFEMLENQIQIEWTVPYIRMESGCVQTRSNELGFVGGICNSEKLLSVLLNFGYNNYHYNNYKFSTSYIGISLKINPFYFYWIKFPYSK